MQRPDQPKVTFESIDQTDQAAPGEAQTDAPGSPTPSVASTDRQHYFDWWALSLIILIAAFFAITARLNAQPSNSLVPIAVLSATGCGLLVTALRKLHTIRGVGVFEAGLGGLFIAIFQFIAAITYPGVFDTLSTNKAMQQGFLITWGLIAACSIIFSSAGAALGHLAFAPLRPAPVASVPTQQDEEESIEDLESEHTGAEVQTTGESDEDERDTTQADEEDTSTTDGADNAQLQPSRSFFSYFVTVLLLGLVPTMAGYIFSAAYDSILSANGFVLSPYPTLRLLSAFLPWQVPVAINLSGGNASLILFTLLWYIPLFFGNPALFDLQALEPIVFNGIALGLLLLTMQGRDRYTSQRSVPMSWGTYLLLQALFGLMLVLPADLWVLRGLQGILQLPDFAIPIRSLQPLNPLTFTLNLITAPLVCVTIGVLLRVASTRWFRTNAAP